MANNTLFLILSVIEDKNDDYKETYAPILAEIIDTYHSINDFIYEVEEGEEDNRQELIDSLEEMDNKWSDDFWLEFDGNEYRIIADWSIWEIYVEEIKNIVEDCYSDVIKLDKIPSFIAVSIDWEQTAKNAYADGYGHTFAGYDGEEHEVNNYWIFRTN